MPSRCCIQYVSKSGRPSSGHRTGKVNPLPSSQESSTKECVHHWTVALISHASKIMLKILDARLQRYMNQEFPDVQAGFRKGRGTRDQIANIRWIMEKAREFQKNIYFCFIDLAKAFDYVDRNKLWNILKGIGPLYLPPEKPVCRSRNNSQNQTWNNRLVPNWERSTSRLYIVTLLI